MTARPILFSGPMVRALLEGRKTQTRRAVKAPTARGGFVLSFNHGIPEFNFGPDDHKPNGDLRWHRCPYGQPGDLLWVRETFMPMPHLNAKAFYRASDRLVGGRWSSPIHMPRTLSRLTLRIADVRVQRLQDISEADAVAEGVEPFTDFLPAGHWRRYRDGGWNAYVDNPIASYASLWTEINGPGSWDANPWVWALTFEVIKANVEQVQP